MTTRITVRLDNQTAKRLREASREEGKKQSELVREALESYFRRQSPPPSAYDLATATGFLGCGEEAPADLSTNKAYMEGFGSS